MRLLLDTNIFVYWTTDKDPSDHVIIAHAMTEKLTLVSSDSRFPFYQKQGLQLIRNEK